MEPFRIIFLNQMAGPLFRELAEDLSKLWSPSLLFTGHPDTVCRSSTLQLQIRKAPSYNRKNYFTRLMSWLHYFFRVILLLSKQPNRSLVFIVSNPPFLGAAGLLFKLLKGIPYIVLVYDIYPDVLVNTGKIKKGLFSFFWDAFNRFVYRHASRVMTIDHDMAAVIESKMNQGRRATFEVATVYPWADVTAIRPRTKGDNPFVQKHHLNGKTVVLYSGNMGFTHPIEPILDAALELSGHPDIHFLMIGEGKKYQLVETFQQRHRLKNLTLLPFQPESVLPYSIASGDIGIVAYENGTQGCMLPSKTFYYMAAGVIPLIMSRAATLFSDHVEKSESGIRIEVLSGNTLSSVILDLHTHPEKAHRFKRNARQAAIMDFSRNNTSKFINALQKNMLQK